MNIEIDENEIEMLRNMLTEKYVAETSSLFREIILQLNEKFCNKKEPILIKDVCKECYKKHWHEMKREDVETYSREELFDVIHDRMKKVKCFAMNGFIDIYQKIPEKCTYHLEHVMKAGKPIEKETFEIEGFD